MIKILGCGNNNSINLFVNELNCRIDGPLAVPPRNMESGINNPLRIRAWMGFR